MRSFLELSAVFLSFQGRQSLPYYNKLIVKEVFIITHQLIERPVEDNRYKIKPMLLKICPQGNKFKRFIGGKIGFLLLIYFFLTPAARAVTTPDPDSNLLRSAYSKSEYFRYDVYWLSRIKAGELTLEIEPDAGLEDSYVVKATLESTGLMAFFYPIEDYFEIIIRGRERLPTYMTQLKDRRGDQGVRITEYDQKNLEVKYTKDDRSPKTYSISGMVHNEFSSVLILRALPLKTGDKLIVPTFTDKKRHEISVRVEETEQRQSILGEVDTLKLQPQLSSEDMYEKISNPDVWLTDDQRRIPVRIRAKIKVGTLTAELKDYRRRE